MGLWLLGIHGQVVAHICKDIRVVVPLYVLIVAICGCLFKGAVPRSPSYGEPFRRGVVVAYVAVVLVFDYPFTLYRGGFHHALVIEYDFVSFAGTTTKWYTNGSKRQGRAGGGIYNGNYHAAFRVHGPQQVYRAETIACALASELGSPV